MTTAPTGFLVPAAASLHDPGWGHPEHQGRLPAIARAVGRDLVALHGHVVQGQGRSATRAELERVHPSPYLDHLEAVAAQARAAGAQVLAGEEVPFSGASWDAVVDSAGAALSAAEAVSEGTFRNAFVATRPPGHHASASTAMGFCAVNHVAVTARHLQATLGAERIAIVDWDVHHGNGTQAIFWRDPSVHFLSLHQHPFYPGTGAAEEVGEGAGEGTTRNVPLREGTAGPEYRIAFDRALSEVEAAFRPDFVLVSAGFDALEEDPVGGLALVPEDFHALTVRVREWAERACQGRLVLLLEGGYAPAPTGAAVALVLRALAGLSA